MASPRSSAGDPARTLALLWRHELDAPSRRGPRQSLDVDAVVDAAVVLADRHGLDAVTMRAVADAVGVSTMSLYTYVPGKAELLDCMLDRLQGSQVVTGYDAGDEGSDDGEGSPAPRWRDRVRVVAEGEWAMHQAHPWLGRVATTRPVLGPGALAAYEHGLRAFEGTGLDDVERDAALTLLTGFVARCAVLHADALSAAADSRTDDRAWWETVSPELAAVMAPSRFPLAARVGTAAGQAHGAAYDAHHAFAFGLPVVLDGLDALVSRRRSGRT